MGAIPASFYKGQEEYDKLTSTLPSDIDSLTETQRVEYALKVNECFERGLPYSDRAKCLFLFYRLLPIDNAEENIPEELASQLGDAAYSVTPNRENIDYLMHLSSNELFQVCQIRGQVNAMGLQLWEVRNDTGLLDKWDKLQNASEEYLKMEPALPVPFLEAYLNAFGSYYYKTKKIDTRLYEVALKTAEYTTEKTSLMHARVVLNNDELLRAYKKKSLSPDDAKKIYALEAFEKKVMSEFDRETIIHNSLGKALNLLSKKRREERSAQKEQQAYWIGDIRRLSRSSTPYIVGYFEYLSSFVYFGTDDLKKSIKSLEKALSLGFDPGSALPLLINSYEILKNKEEAARYAQKLLIYSNTESLQDAEEDEYIQQLVLTIKAANQEPKFAPETIERMAKENAKKKDKLISDLEPKIESAAAEIKIKRMDSSIDYFDSLIPIIHIDELLNQGRDLKNEFIDIPYEKFMQLSLEELEFYQEKNFEDLLQFYSLKVSLHHLINYVEALCLRKYSDINSHLAQILKSFPNLFSSFPIIEKYCASFVEANNISSAQRVALHAIENRPSSKVRNIYPSIKPIAKGLHTKETIMDEINLLKKVRRLLYDDDLLMATTDLTDAYLFAIDSEKPLKTKSKLLDEAESENLSDERFGQIRKQVDFQLNKRKKILTWIAIGAGAIVVIAIILTVVLKQ